MGNTNSPLRALGFVAAMPTDERDLLVRLQQGDERALEIFMQRHGAKLGAVAFALLGRSDLAKDVVQEVFIAFWEQREIINIHHNVAGYLARAVRNRALNLVRQERRHWRVEDEADVYDPSMMLVAYNAAERSLEDGDFLARVFQALKAVPPQPRKAFLLSWHAGLTYPEIADLLDVTVPTVYKMMYRATERLAQIFSSEVSP